MNAMAVNLHILKASGRLHEYESRIQTAFEEGLDKVAARLALPDVDVVVADNPDAAIPETGVGGYSPTAHLLYISIGPLHENVEKTLEQEIRSTLAHELHHCARWHTIGYGKTLLETIVSEGLADHFDLEVNGGVPRPWSVALSAEELERMRKQAASEFNSRDYKHTDWFFGSPERSIPKWTGYTLGFTIVKEHLEKTGKTASELAGESANTFIGLYHRNDTLQHYDIS